LRGFRIGETSSEFYYNSDVAFLHFRLKQDNMTIRGGGYSGATNNFNNTLQGSGMMGWTETQPDGTTFNYDTSGLLRTIRNNAGVC
jgi:hypothetical protein